MADSVRGTFGEYENEHTALRAAIAAVDDFLDGLRVQAASLFDQIEEARTKLDDYGKRIDKLEKKPVLP